MGESKDILEIASICHQPQCKNDLSGDQELLAQGSEKLRAIYLVGSSEPDRHPHANKVDSRSAMTCLSGLSAWPWALTFSAENDGGAQLAWLSG